MSDQQPESLTSQQIAGQIPGGIDYSDGRVVRVCTGANCSPAGEQVVRELRELDTKATPTSCHGAIGGCAINGSLEGEMCYATVPRITDEGIIPVEVCVRPRVSVANDPTNKKAA